MYINTRIHFRSASYSYALAKYVVSFKMNLKINLPRFTNFKLRYSLLIELSKLPESFY